MDDFLTFVPRGRRDLADKFWSDYRTQCTVVTNCSAGSWRLAVRSGSGAMSAVRRLRLCGCMLTMNLSGKTIAGCTPIWTSCQCVVYASC